MKVSFDNPEFEKGTEFDIGGLLLINGDEVDVDDEALELYQARHGYTLADAVYANPHASASGPGSQSHSEAFEKVFTESATSSDPTNEDDDKEDKEGDD